MKSSTFDSWAEYATAFAAPKGSLVTLNVWVEVAPVGLNVIQEGTVLLRVTEKEEALVEQGASILTSRGSEGF